MVNLNDIVVCIPTVKQRAEVLDLTVSDWRRIGLDPLVFIQPEDWPIGPSSKQNSERAIHETLIQRPDARFVLFSEDDIMISDYLLDWLPALLNLNSPVTLCVIGDWHYPPGIRARCRRSRVLPECIIRVANVDAWHGSQAVLMPRWVVERLDPWQSPFHGWDIHFQKFLQEQHLPLYAPVPNPVEHRQVVSTHSVDPAWLHSATFGRPSDHAGVTPTETIDWSDGSWLAFQVANHQARMRDRRQLRLEAAP